MVLTPPSHETFAWASKMTRLGIPLTLNTSLRCLQVSVSENGMARHDISVRRNENQFKVPFGWELFIDLYQQWGETSAWPVPCTREIESHNPPNQIADFNLKCLPLKRLLSTLEHSGQHFNLCFPNYINTIFKFWGKKIKIPLNYFFHSPLFFSSSSFPSPPTSFSSPSTSLESPLLHSWKSFFEYKGKEGNNTLHEY